MTKLIVALDLPSPHRSRELMDRLRIEAGVEWFKVEDDTLLRRGGLELCEEIVARANLFLDLKNYKTRDSVTRIATAAFELGARFLTVHATPSMLEAAMRVKPAWYYHKVLAVAALTDTAISDRDFNESFIMQVGCWGRADGLICSPHQVKLAREQWKLPKLIVCPSIRPITSSSAISGSHANPSTPAEARAAGADYIVVGRPIYDAPDPIAAARAIMEEVAE